MGMVSKRNSAALDSVSFAAQALLRTARPVSAGAINRPACVAIDSI